MKYNKIQHLENEPLTKYCTWVWQTIFTRWHMLNSCRKSLFLINVYLNTEKSRHQTDTVITEYSAEVIFHKDIQKKDIQTNFYVILLLLLLFESITVKRNVWEIFACTFKVKALSRTRVWVSLLVFMRDESATQWEAASDLVLKCVGQVKCSLLFAI